MFGAEQSVLTRGNRTTELFQSIVCYTTNLTEQKKIEIIKYKVSPRYRLGKLKRRTAVEYSYNKFTQS